MALLCGELLAVPQAPTNPGLTHLCQCRSFRGTARNVPQLFDGPAAKFAVHGMEIGREALSQIGLDSGDGAGSMFGGAIQYCTAMIFRGTSPAIRRSQVWMGKRCTCR